VLDAVFWASLALLGVTIPSYVFVVSLLAEATQAARVVSRRLRESLSAEIGQYSAELRTTGLSSQRVKELQAKIKDHGKAIRRYESLASGFRIREVLILPSFFFALSAASATYAAENPIIVPMPWSALTAAPLAIGGWLLYRAMYRAYQVRDLSLPEVRIEIVSIPDTWRVGNYHSIVFRATLEKGMYVEGGMIVLFVPPTFESPSGLSPAWQVPTSDPLLPGYKAIASLTWDYKPLAPFRFEFHHMTPTQQGKFSLYYALYGKGFSTELVSLDVTVSR